MTIGDPSKTSKGQEQTTSFASNIQRYYNKNINFANDRIVKIEKNDDQESGEYKQEQDYQDYLTENKNILSDFRLYEKAKKEGKDSLYTKEYFAQAIADLANETIYDPSDGFLTKEAKENKELGTKIYNEICTKLYADNDFSKPSEIELQEDVKDFPFLGELQIHGHKLEEETKDSILNGKSNSDINFLKEKITILDDINDQVIENIRQIGLENSIRNQDKDYQNKYDKINSIISNYNQLVYYVKNNIETLKKDLKKLEGDNKYIVKNNTAETRNKYNNEVLNNNKDDFKKARTSETSSNKHNQNVENTNEKKVFNTSKVLNDLSLKTQKLQSELVYALKDPKISAKEEVLNGYIASYNNYLNMLNNAYEKGEINGEGWTQIHNEENSDFQKKDKVRLIESYKKLIEKQNNKDNNSILNKFKNLFK